MLKEQQEVFICPDCQKKAMVLKNGEAMYCMSCNTLIQLDIYMMSLLLLLKEILILLLKEFIIPGHGKLIEYQLNVYLVGISKSGNYICQEYLLQDDLEVGMYVSFLLAGEN